MDCNVLRPKCSHRLHGLTYQILSSYFFFLRPYSFLFTANAYLIFSALLPPHPTHVVILSHAYVHTAVTWYFPSITSHKWQISCDSNHISSNHSLIPGFTTVLKWEGFTHISRVFSVRKGYENVCVCVSACLHAHTYTHSGFSFWWHWLYLRIFWLARHLYCTISHHSFQQYDGLIGLLKMIKYCYHLLLIF